MQRRRLTAALEVPKRLSGIHSCQVTHYNMTAVLCMCRRTVASPGLLVATTNCTSLCFAVGSAPALNSRPGAKGSSAAGLASTSSPHCAQSGAAPHVGCQQAMSTHSCDGRSVTTAVSSEFVAPPSTPANLTAVDAAGADPLVPAAPQSRPPATAQPALPGCPSPTREAQVRTHFLYEFRTVIPPWCQKTYKHLTRWMQNIPSGVAFVKVVVTSD